VCEKRPELGLWRARKFNEWRKAMSYAKLLREKQARLATQMRALVDSAKKADRGLNTEERTQWHNFVTDFEANEETIKAEERIATIETSLGSIPEDEIVPAFADVPAERDTNKMLSRRGRKPIADNTPHGKAFAKWLRGGMSMLSPEEQGLMQSRAVALDGLGIKNAQTVTGSGGGYLIPQGFSEQLEEALKWFGGIVGFVDEFTTDTGNPLPWPTDNDVANKGRMLAINTQVTETDVTFGQVTFNAFTGSSDLVLVPIQLMQDSYFDMDSYLARKLGTRLGRLMNQQCTIGTGGGTAPTGIQVAAIAAGNNVQGAVGSATGIKYADLVNVMHAVDPAYRVRPSARFMFNDQTLKVIRQLVDTASRPLWQPGISAGFGNGFPSTILDKEYVINSDMPNMAASAYGVLFGDLSLYKLRRVAGGVTVMRLVERYADYLQVGFLAFVRFDGNLIDAGTHPVATWQNSAT
jgi:HK97 family phage major capsid protein